MSSRPLFRIEVTEAAELDATLEARPVPWATVAGYLALVSAFLLAAAHFGTYARKETVSGYLVPAAGVSRVSAPRAGVAAQVHVGAGEAVRVGAPLFTLQYDEGLAGGGSVDDALRRSLDSEARLLSSRLGAERARMASETVRLRAQAEGLKAQAASLAEQREFQSARVVSAERRLRALELLRAKGVVSEPQFRSQEEAVLALKQGLASIGERQAAAAQQSAETASTIARLDSETAERRAQLQGELARIDRSRVEAEAGGAQVIRAASAGRIASLQLTPGQSLEPGKPVLAIVPQRSALLAVLHVPTRAVAFVEPGQEVRLMYDAFPFQRFGAARGRVVRVARAASTPEDVLGPIKPREPGYQVEVALERQAMSAFGRAFALQPDMTLKAHIVLERRSFLEWLLEPLIAVRALR